MSEATEIKFKPEIFSKEHRIILHPEFIEHYKSPEDTEPVKFSKLEIDAIRYGVIGNKFYLGKTFLVVVKNFEGKKIKFHLKSAYNIRNEELVLKYNLVLNTIIKFYLLDTISQYCKMIDDKLSFSILNIYFDEHGITLRNGHKIKWEDLSYKIYGRYLTIIFKRNPEINKTLDFVYDWNTIIIYNIIRVGLKAKGVLKE